MTKEWGDWTWAYKTQGWLGTYVVSRPTAAETWSEPIPVNVRPLKHGGCRLGCWQLPSARSSWASTAASTATRRKARARSTRSALMRSDDGGENWEYYLDPRLRPGQHHRLRGAGAAAPRRRPAGLLPCAPTSIRRATPRTWSMVVSEDDGFSWTPPKWTNIWGYPAEMIAAAGRPLSDDLRLSPPALRRRAACVSEDGVTWDVKNEFVIREGGVPGRTRAPSARAPAAWRRRRGKYGGGGIDWDNPGVYQHIGYPSVAQMPDGTIVASYHEWSEDDRAAAVRALHPLPARRLRPRAMRARRAIEHRSLHREPLRLLRPPASLARWPDGDLARSSSTARRAGRSSCIRPQDPLVPQPADALDRRGPELDPRRLSCRASAGTASSAPG